MTETINKKGKSLLGRFWFWLTTLLIVVVLSVGYVAIKPDQSGNAIADQPAYEVKQGPLTISIGVTGTIQAKDKLVIKNELEGSSTILYVVPEGTQVKEGDLLVELDASTLTDQRVDQQIMVQNAEAAFINARENLAIVENQAQSDIEQAELVYEFAKQDLEKYIQGEFPKLMKEKQREITLNQEELTRAEQELKWSQILYEEKYLSKTELMQDEIAKKRFELNMEVAQADLELVKEYQYKRDIAQLKSDVKQTRMALERTQRKASASIVQASADLQAKISEFERQKSKLQKIEDQIKKAKIYAPREGLVVYATSVRMSFRGNDEPLQEGQSVRERQELIHLPTTSSYVAEVKIHESYLDKVRLGLPVRITVDALPGSEYIGELATIAPLPDAQSVFMNPDLKVYNTEIQIQGEGNDLRSGMSCNAEIVIDQFENTTYIPITAVTRLDGKPTVFVAENNRWMPREIVLGPDNNRLAQIKDGLDVGDQILLTPPITSVDISEDENTAQNGKFREMIEESKNNLPSGIMDQQSYMGGSPRSGGGERMQAPGGNRGSQMSGGGPEQGRSRAPQMSGEDAGQGRGPGQGFGGQRDQNLTPEQREQFRKRMENMSEEERNAMRQRMQQRRQQQPQQE